MSNVTNQKKIAAAELLSRLCRATVGAFAKLMKSDRCNTEARDAAWVVVVRTLHDNSEATVEDVKAAWYRELDFAPDQEIIELALTMHFLLGPDWHLICVNRYLLENNDDVRDKGLRREECPLFGDSIEEVLTHWWKATCDKFDEKQAAKAKAILAKCAA